MLLPKNYDKKQKNYQYGEEDMNLELIKQNETLIDDILSALAWNKIDMSIALIGMAKITSQKDTTLLMELDEFLRKHNGEITEEQFQQIVSKAKPPER